MSAGRYVLAVVVVVGGFVTLGTGSKHAIGAGQPESRADLPASDPASAADHIDWAQTLDVDRQGDVVIGFQTDVVHHGAVRRFSADGAFQAHWTPPGWTTGLATDAISRVIVGLSEEDRTEIYDPIGVPITGWDEAGLLPNLAVGAVGDSEPQSIYLIRARRHPPLTPEPPDPLRPLELVRVGLDGIEAAVWPVNPRTYDVAWGTVGDPAEGVVYTVDSDVQTAGTANLVLYDTSGRRFVSPGQPAASSLDGEVKGVDVAADGSMAFALVGELAAVGRLVWFDPGGPENGPALSSCALPGMPVDLAVAPLESGATFPDAWVILWHPLDDPAATWVYRLRSDCSVVTAWSPADLVREGTPPPTRTRVPPLPGDTMTPVPTSMTPTDSTPTPSPITPPQGKTGTPPPPGTNLYLPRTTTSP